MKNFLILLTPTDILLGVIFSVVAIFPTSMILKRLGFSGWWSLVCFVPGAALIFLWVLAFIRWPSVESANAPQA